MFDGDELNVYLILDNNMHMRLSRYASHLSVLALNKPRSISKNISLPQQVLVTVGNWMDDV